MDVLVTVDEQTFTLTGGFNFTYCAPGKYLNSNECVGCAAGKYNNMTRVPFLEKCNLCSEGKYSQSGSSECTVCIKGKFSNIERTICDNCESGQYTKNNGCLDCEDGKYAPTPQTGECLTCNAGFLTNNVSGATTCSKCDVGDDSYEGSSSCDLAAEGYYLFKGNSKLCPENAVCVGENQAPIPKPDFWVDRRMYGYMGSIHACTRSTCMYVGRNTSDACWSELSFNSTSLSLIASNCDSNHLICSQGAVGPLCGSCKEGFIYQSETKTCKSCADTSLSIRILVMSLIIFMILFFLVIIFQSRNKKFDDVKKLISCFDSGSLKLLWATYQIIMSCSWNLDVTFPDPFNNMLGFMTVFSLDFLTLECLQKSGSASTRYFPKFTCGVAFPSLPLSSSRQLELCVSSCSNKKK